MTLKVTARVSDQELVERATRLANATVLTSSVCSNDLRYKAQSEIDDTRHSEWNTTHNAAVGVTSKNYEEVKAEPTTGFGREGDQ